MAAIWAAKLTSRAEVVSYDDIVSDPDAVVSRIKRLVPGLDIPAGSPAAADDRGCAGPYLQRLHQAARLAGE